MTLTEEQRAAIFNRRTEELKADLEQAERVIEARLEVIDQQAAKIRELEADVLQKSILCDSIAENCNGLRNRAWKAEARIKELEDAHKRAGAKYAKIIRELRSSVYANIPGLKKQWDEVLADGKISIGDHIVGPDQMVPCWQITEERKAALKRLYGLLVIRYKYSYPDETETLRAMLTEAE